MKSTELIKLLSDHVNAVTNLQYSFGNYALAEQLYQRTKMYASKYFHGKHYGIELVGIRFRPFGEVSWTTEEEYKKAWDTGFVKLLSVARAMYDDTCLTPIQRSLVTVIENTKQSELEQQVKSINKKYNELEEKYYSLENEKIRRQNKIKKQKRVVIFIFCLLILSLVLWNFNSLLKWNWLSGHPKKIGIYLSMQLLIFFTLLRLVTNYKAIKFADWIMAIIIAVLSLI